MQCPNYELTLWRLFLLPAQSGHRSAEVQQGPVTRWLWPCFPFHLHAVHWPHLAPSTHLQQSHKEKNRRLGFCEHAWQLHWNDFFPDLLGWFSFSFLLNSSKSKGTSARFFRKYFIYSATSQHKLCLCLLFFDYCNTNVHPLQVTECGSNPEPTSGALELLKNHHGTQWCSSPRPVLNSAGVRKPLLCRSRLSNTSSSCSGDSGSSPCSLWPQKTTRPNNCMHFHFLTKRALFFFLLTCMSRFVMKPFPSLSQSTNSSRAFPMVSLCGLPKMGSLELGEVRGLRTRPATGVPGGRVRCRGLKSTASPLPSPSSTKLSPSQWDITAWEKAEASLRFSNFSYGRIWTVVLPWASVRTVAKCFHVSLRKQVEL